MTVAIFAADRRPVVTINSAKNYKIVIDGRNYFGNDITINLNNLYAGRHTIKVYEMKKGLFVKGEKLVDAASFQISRNDIAIKIDRFGNILIREKNKFNRFELKDKKYRDDDFGSIKKKTNGNRF